MTLVRYNANGSIDATFGSGGFATRQFGGTPSQTSGNSGATAMTQDASGNIVVAGFGGSQSMVVARFTAAGAYQASAVCYAPHLIDYTARALAIRPNGSIVLVGYGRDRHASAAVPPTGPAVLYGLRATVALPASGNSTTACGAYSSNGTLSLGSAGVTVDGLNHDGSGADPAWAGRFYDAVVALPDNGYVVGTTNGPGGTAWVQRYSAAGAIDNSFGGGRVVLPASAVHAMALLGDGSVLAAGETVDAAVSANRHMQVARITSTGAMAAWGAGGFARSRVAGGNNTGQALVVLGDGSIIVGGSANLAGKTAFALTRFTAAGARDPVFGNNGETTTPFGTPAVNGYITGMALAGNLLAVSGRLTNAAGLVVTAARYYATGAPPPPPPPPAVSTLGVDGITASSARVTGTVNANGTAATWWLEYGTTTAYGSKSASQALPATTNDLDVGVNVTGLNSGTLYHARLVISNGLGTTPGRRRHVHDARRSRRRRGDARRPGQEGRQEGLQGAQGRRQEDQRRAQEGLARGLQVQGRLQEVEAAEERRHRAVAQGQQEAGLPRGREAHRRDEAGAEEEVEGDREEDVDGQGEVHRQGVRRGALGPSGRARARPPVRC